ncbi:MAG: hypothetical protein R3321_03945 [Nitrososphaeraceae archaeon]|nr:hypothetical protein [Nitrososphaeraceae archaeon]
MTKLPCQSSHPDNIVSPVPIKKVYGVDFFGEIKNNKQLVELSYGAGKWWIYLPHWKMPNKIDEKYPAKIDTFSRKPYPNTKDGNIQRIIDVAKDFKCTKAQTAYLLATTRWETGNKFIPNVEAYWLSEAWRKRNLRYYPYHG